MTDAYIQTYPDGTGKKVDNSLLNIGGEDVYRQRVETYNGVTDDLNSTSAALGSAGAWTGTGRDVTGYGSVVVATKSDQAGTLYMEFSPDNVNWDSSLSFVVAANVNEVHRLSVTRKYFRIRYVNGATPQSRLTTSSTQRKKRKRR